MNSQDFDRMYVHHGTRAHLIRRTMYGERVAACGLYPWPAEFLGTGDQTEYEHAEHLPTCRHCERVLTKATQ